MAAPMTRDQFDRAVTAAADAAAAYYHTGTVIMADAEYDALIDAITETAAVHPDWDTRGLLDKVAGGTAGTGEVTHPSLMGSLEKAKDIDAVAKFVDTVTGPVVVEPKLDGLAIRAEYTAGVLTLLATRGDGHTGEDVTTQAGQITGLPTTLPTDATFEVRGEVYMTDADFEKSNENRVASGAKPFANPRNAVAGSLRSSDRSYDVHMTFSAYDVYPTGVLADTHLQTMDVVGSWGILSARDLVPVTPVTGADATVAAINAIGEQRDTLGFPIDGAVIKADRFADRDRLGMATRAPKWAVAFKYAPNEATTTLTGIEVGVGRTGRISLRAVLDPVTVGGTTVTYATLHNPKFVQDQGLAIGQRVMVVRAGDVIPRVTAAIGEQPDGLVAWQPPQTCPQCSEPWDTSSLLWRCTTPSCSQLARLVYFCQRDALDIEGIGEEIATALVESGLVVTPADLYDLTAAQIADVVVGQTPTGKPRKIGATVAAKLVAEINGSKSQPLNRVVTALGVRGTGRTMGRRLASHFKSLAAIRAASEDDLAQVDGIGTEKAKLIVAGLAAISGEIDRLVAAGLTVDMPDTDTDTAALPLAGKTVVVSGAVPGLTRTEANEWVERLGGKSSGSVSKNTGLLVAGDGSGSKSAKAEALGVEVMTADAFAALVNSYR